MNFTKLKKLNLLFSFKIVPLLVLIVVLGLSIGYSAFVSKVNISKIVTEVRRQENIRITKVNVNSVNNDGQSIYEDYNKQKLLFGVNLPKQNSSVTYKVEVTNIGNVEMGILEITGLPSNLDYELKDYELGTKLCNNNKCNLGMKKEFYITIKYKSNGYTTSGVHTYDINLDVNFKPAYKVTYERITNNNYKDTVLETDTLEITFTTPVPSDAKPYVGGVRLKDYTYANNKLTVPNVMGNVTIYDGYKDPVIPTATLTATKKTAGTQVSSNTWSTEGLNFKITQQTVGSSGATIYYCKDTNNTCNPTTKVTSGTTITSYNSLVQNEYYIRYKIVSGEDLTSGVNSYKARVDNKVPTITMLGSGQYELTNTSPIVKSATYGISGGSWKCINLDNNSNTVTTLQSLYALGNNNIRCTATGNNGLTFASQDSYYQLSTSLDFSSGLFGITTGGSLTNGVITLPPNTGQFGPYIDAVKGCYLVLYKGENLNYAANNLTVQYGAWQGGTPIIIDIFNLNYLSSDLNYYFELTDFAKGLEVKLHNPKSSPVDVKITSIRIEYAGDSCN